MCEQLAQGCYLKAEQPRVEPATLSRKTNALNHYATRPHTKIIGLRNLSDFTLLKRHITGDACAVCKQGRVPVESFLFQRVNASRRTGLD